MDGRILRIERTSIHDGPGLRTVIYFKGCPLRCKWCSTPESQSLHVTESFGRIMRDEEIVQEIEKDEIFFFHSGGGMTLSGGEVLMQADFAANILNKCKSLGIHTAIETSFCFPYDEIEKVAPYLNALYVDIKLMNDSEHQRMVGISNHQILKNIEKFSYEYPQVDLHVRTPMIPSINMNEDNIETTLTFCERLNSLLDVEFLPYHRLGMQTYQSLGMQYELEYVKVSKDETLLAIAKQGAKKHPMITIKVLNHVYNKKS